MNKQIALDRDFGHTLKFASYLPAIVILFSLQVATVPQAIAQTAHNVDVQMFGEVSGPGNWRTGGAGGSKGDTDVVVNNFVEDSVMDLSFFHSPSLFNNLGSACFPAPSAGVLLIDETAGKGKKGRGESKASVSFIFWGFHGSNHTKAVQYRLVMDGTFGEIPDIPQLGLPFSGWFYLERDEVFRKAADDSIFETYEAASAQVTEWTMTTETGKGRKNNPCTGKGSFLADTWVEVTHPPIPFP